MMILIFFLVFTSIYGDDAQPCETFTKDDPIEYDLVIECLDSMEFDIVRQNETLEYVKSLLNMYVYRDIVSDSGDPWNQQVDIIKDLENFSGNFRTDYEFHAALRDVVSKLNDPHTAYMPPTCYGFRFYQPFPIRQLDDGTFQITAFWNPEDIDLDIPKLYQETYPTRADLYLNEYEGFEILKIDGDDPLEVITNYARDECSYSRDEMIRYNYVLRSEWHKRSTSRNKVPANRMIEYTLLDPSDGSNKTIEVPWMAVPTNTYRFENMESLCGYKPPEEQERRRRSLSHSEEEEEEGKKNTFHKFLESPYLTSVIPSRYTYLQKIMRDALHVHEIERQIGYFSEESKERRRRGLEEDSVITPKWYKSVTLSSSSKYKYYRLFVHNTTKVAVLRVITFMPTMEIMAPTTQEALLSTLEAFQAYFDQLYSAFAAMSRLEIEKVILDVRGNVGGVGCLAFVLLRYLSPYAPLDPSPNTDLIYTKLGDELHCQFNIVDRLTFFNQDREPVTSTWFNHGPTRKRGLYTSQYSTLVHFGCEMQMTILGAERRWEASPKMFEPEDVTILTDGTCGSTCGVFVKLVQYLQLGRIVSQGGMYGSPKEDQESMNTASFPGGAVTTADTLLQEISMYSAVCPISEENLISKPNTNAMITFAWLEIYAWNPLISAFELDLVEDSVPMGHTLKPADFHIASWDFGSDILGSTELLQYFDSCADWMIQKNMEDCTPAENPIEHAIYGNPCVGGEFDDTTCVLRGCDSGYYLSLEKDRCLEMPEEYDIIGMAIKILMAGFFIAFLIVGVYLCYFCYICSMIMLLCIAFVLMVFRLGRKKNRGRRGTGVNREAQNGELQINNNGQEEEMGEYARLPAEEDGVEAEEIEMEMLNDKDEKTMEL